MNVKLFAIMVFLCQSCSFGMKIPGALNGQWKIQTFKLSKISAIGQEEAKQKINLTVEIKAGSLDFSTVSTVLKFKIRRIEVGSPTDIYLPWENFPETKEWDWNYYLLEQQPGVDISLAVEQKRGFLYFSWDGAHYLCKKTELL